MAINSDYDFVGGYEHDTQAGVLHVANHHVSPGKKQWTWGHSDFGVAWDRNLTDEDGPYIELMTGVFTDNQPDFSWLMPYEEKSFTQYFMPYRELGLVKNASKDLLVNVEKDNANLLIKVFATSKHDQVTLKLLSSTKKILLEEIIAVSPEKIYTRSVPADAATSVENIVFMLINAAGMELLRYEPAKNKKNEIPQPAKAALPPAEVSNNEQLFLTGQHLEQYRHATYSPVPYYEEALRRDAGDIRNNNALGAWYLRRGQFSKSEPFFRQAIATSIQRNANPYDSEPYYNLGLCLKYQGRHPEAYEVFYKATWGSAWQSSAFFSLAQIDLLQGEPAAAATHAQMSLDRNMGNGKAWALKAAACNAGQQYERALPVCAEGLQRDAFNLSLYWEQRKAQQALGNETGADKALQQFLRHARGYVHNFIEYALDYAAAGLYDDAIALLNLYVEKATEPVYPIVWYYLGWLQYEKNDIGKAIEFFEQAARADGNGCFPNRLEDIAVLQLATKVNGIDAKAPYYLGSLWYDKRQYNEAIAHWELSAQRDDQFPTVFRNLGIAYFNKQQDASKALSCYEKAFALGTNDARVLMELDQLYKRLNKDVAERLQFLEKHLRVVEQRDDLYLERASLYNFGGQYEKAFQQIMDRKFHPWEGGEGKVSAQYVFSLTEMAKQCIQEKDYTKAIDLLQQAQVYPHNLGEGKLFGARENDIFYWLGVAYAQMGNKKEANEYFNRATDGLTQPTAAMFYNDQQPDKIFYQGLAWKQLGNEERASAIFNTLIEYGAAHRDDEIQIDYFAVSLPNLLIFDDDLNARNCVHCDYMMGLGFMGLGDNRKAKECFERVLVNDNMHFGTQVHLAMVEDL
jgi:tetratricopeptide (TPR) repeat protein